MDKSVPKPFVGSRLELASMPGLATRLLVDLSQDVKYKE